ncbi:MAG: type II toxin-antitoxin system prevent-host-death family antitoxin [Prevotellaceae bacterium]|jgi:antitoxin YefM|nr:type II toxin-antitoxin system prevent-host-death family antitoxin [Prevotellaceae bacterium]
MNHHLTLGTREFTRNMGKWLDKSSSDKVGIIITRQKGEDVIVLPMSEYNSLAETAYLLKSPANAEHLFRGMEAVRNTTSNGGNAVTDFNGLWK